MSSNALAAQDMQQFKLSNSVKSGANWLMFIGFATALNSVLIASGNTWSLVMGLGITQVATYVAQEGMINLGLVIYISLVVWLAFGFLGVFAKRQHLWAFLIGLVVYGLDSLLFLFVQDWFSLAFHALALFGIVQGVRSMLALRTLRMAEPAPPIASIIYDGANIDRVVVGGPGADALFTQQQRTHTRSLLRRIGIPLVITLIVMGLFAAMFYLY